MTSIHLFFIFLAIASTSITHAGVFIQNNGSITSVTTGNSSDPTAEKFYIKVSNPEGTCTPSDWIEISKSDFGNNTDSYKAAYSLALSAIASNSNKVSVFNAVSNSCAKATWLQISK